MYSNDSPHKQSDSNNNVKFHKFTKVSKVSTIDRVPDIHAADPIRKLSRLSNTSVVKTFEQHLHVHNLKTVSSKFFIDSAIKKTTNKSKADSSLTKKVQSKTSIEHPKTESKREPKNVSSTIRTSENGDKLQNIL